MPNIVFFGSSSFSNIVLKKILSAKYKVLSVVTTPDLPAGRGLKLSPNPVKLAAQKHRLPVFTDIKDFLASRLPPNSIALVAAHGRLLGPKTLSKFNNRVYIIHPSLLPKYRGPSPLQQQILDEETETGVTIIQADLGQDTGPVVAQQTDSIRLDDTWITLGNRLFATGADLFLSLALRTSHLVLVPQNNSKATFTRKLTRADGFIPWEEFIKFDSNRKFQAYYNWPGIWSINPAGQRVKLVSLHPRLVQYEGKLPQKYEP